MTFRALPLLVALACAAAAMSAVSKDLWLIESGRIVRVDTATGDAGVVPIMDGVRAVAPTADGGAWIVRNRTLVRVDETMLERASVALAEDEAEPIGPMAADPYAGTLWIASGPRLLHFSATGQRLHKALVGDGAVKALAVAGPEAVFVATDSSITRYDGAGAPMARLDLSQVGGGAVVGMAIDPLAGFLWLARSQAWIQFDVLVGIVPRLVVSATHAQALSVDTATGGVAALDARELFDLDRDGNRRDAGVTLSEPLHNVVGIERSAGRWLWFGDERGFGAIELPTGNVVRTATQPITRFELAPPRFDAHIGAAASEATGGGTDISLRYVSTCDGAICTPTTAFLRSLRLDAWLDKGDVSAAFKAADGSFTGRLSALPWQGGPSLLASTVDAFGNRSFPLTLVWPIARDTGSLAPKASAGPTISITAPINNATFTAPAATTIKATATPGTGASISKVEFFVGATLIGTVTVAPYNLAWSNVQVGTYVLTAKVTDSLNATATSPAITVAVNAGALAKPIDAWLLNDAWTSATPITDAAGVRDGTPTGTLAAVASAAAVPKPNTCKAASFTGGAVDIAGLAVSTVAAARTSLAFWMYWNGTDNVMPAGWVTEGLVLSGGSFGFTTQNGDVFGISSAGFMNKWQHVVAEFANGSVATNKIYINGVPQALTQRAGTPLVANAVVAATLRIGGLTGNAGLRFLGQLDEVKLFNRALTAVEASAEFAAANACDTAPAVALTAPANNANFIAPASIALTATATVTSATATLTKVAFYNGSTLLATRTAAPFTYTWANVPVGSYRLTAKATDSKGSTATTAVATANVKTNAAPTVSMTSPANNSVFTAPASINLAASASDADGTVAKVEFYQGTTKLATLTAAPYTYAWTNVAGATYSLTAKATDDRGTVTTSTAVSVIVNKAPAISITAPTNNAIITLPSTITINATATDSDGSIAKVEFYRDGVLIATDTTSPYSYVWASPTVGVYVLTAKATDNRGAFTTSSPITVNVKNNQPPVITITSPVNGGKIPLLAPFAFTVSASDPDGTIAKVEFYRNQLGNSLYIAGDTTSPYSVMAPPFPDPGSYTLEAWAFDNKGVVTVSAPVTVATNVLPVMQVTQPQQDEYLAPAVLPDIPMAVNATDPDGRITAVRFYKRTEQWDGGIDKGGDAARVLLGTVTAPPYQWTWRASSYTDPSGTGVAVHWISMEAVDDTGEVADSGEMGMFVWKDPQASTAQFNFIAPTSSPAPVYPAPASIVLVGSGSGIASVEWFANGVSLGATAAANGANGEFAFPWRNVTAGTYVITVRFVDVTGRIGTATAGPLSITVGLPAPPIVTIVNPTTGSVVTAGQSLPATANVQNFVAGPYNFIEFTDNYDYAGWDYDVPFTATYAPAPGIHELRAQARYLNRAVGDPARAWIIAPVVPRAPVGVMTSPSPTGAYTTATPITLSVDAKARDGSIGSVDFYSGGTLIKKVASPPYTFTTQFASGGQSVYAAINALFGPRSFTTPVNFSVAGANAGITVIINSPSNGQNVVVPGALPLAVTVIDPNRKVTQVVYTWTANVNGGQVAASSTPPYSASWNLTSVWPQYVLVATAWTANGPVNSQPVIFNGVSNQSPTVAITTPAAGQTFFAGQPIPVTVSASDPDGTVSKVEFFTSSGTLLGTSSTAPFTFNWSPAVAGTYSIYATATDDRGATTQSAAIAGIVIAANAIPAVSLVSPQNNSKIAAGATVRLAATAVDADGTIARVEFYAGSTLLGSASSYPYLLAWSNVAAGTYTLTARAVDNRGAVTISAPVSVAAQTLAVTITSPAANAQIAADFVTVTGTYQAPPNSGVTVNGTVARTDGQGTFYLNDLSLVPGSNTITVVLATSDGTTTAATQDVSSTAIPPFQISLDPDSGIAPTTATVRVALRGASDWTTIAFSGLGTGVLDTTGFTPAVPGKITFAIPGTYHPKVTLTDAAGNTYAQTLTITVNDAATIASLVKSVWTGFAGALAGGDKNAALDALSGVARVRYAPVFDTLDPYLPQIVGNWSVPKMGRLSDGIAEMSVARNIDGIKRLFFIYLLPDRYGIWRLENM